MNEAKIYLNRNRLLKKTYEARLERLVNLRARTTTIASPMAGGEKIQSSIKIFDKTAEIICDIAVLEEQLTKDIYELAKTEHEIMTKIKGLENPRHRLILELYYLNFRTLEEISCAIEQSFQWIHKQYKDALMEFEKKYF